MSITANLRVQCPKCQGAGMVNFRAEFPRHADALDYLREAGGCTANELWQSAATGHYATRTITAMNNRLEDLREWGMVYRWREGRGWIYELTDYGLGFAVLHPAGRTP
jgi:hypothetical protein